MNDANIRDLNLDNDGFLSDTSQWTEDIAIALATDEGIELTEAHWEIIYTVRKFYDEFDLAPAMRPLSRYIKQTIGPDKAGSIYLMTLFPESPARRVARIAGLPRPENCL